MPHVCPVATAPNDPKPFKQGDNLNFKAHDVGWIICGFFTLIASAASFWLIWKHLTFYTCPQQQRHIVRMLFMPPIYAIVSTLSYVFFREAIYYQTVRDCYEAVVITSFFCLLLQYVGDTPAEQHEVFRRVKVKKWFWPLGFWKYRPTGLHFLWLMKLCILQYAIVRPICTLVAVGLQYFGLYCLESWAPYFGHLYLSIAISISVTIAMYCIVQFYLPIQEELKPYSPVLKFLAVKSVVFLTFWQDSFLGLLVSFGVIKPSQFMTAAEIQVGYDALLETFEMVIFSFLHVKAFTYIIYRPSDRKRVTRRWRAFLDVCDYRDWFYHMKQTTRYMSERRRGQDLTVADDIRKHKYEVLERALGRDRWAAFHAEQASGKKALPSFWAAGCEPKDDEDDMIGNSPTRHTERGLPLETEAMQERTPHLLSIVGQDYDPEAQDETPLDDGYIPGDIDARREETTRMLPRLQRIPVNHVGRRSPALDNEDKSSRSRPIKDYRDDPEMEKPARRGWVTAGPRSYLQTKARNVIERLRSNPNSPNFDANSPLEELQRHNAGVDMDFAESQVPQAHFMRGSQRDSCNAELASAQITHGNDMELGDCSILALPAPSQLLDRRGADPFGIARHHSRVAEEYTIDSNSPSHQQTNHTEESRPSSLGLQVGSIVTRRDLEHYMSNASPTSPSRLIRTPALRGRYHSAPLEQSNTAFDPSLYAHYQCLPFAHHHQRQELAADSRHAQRRPSAEGHRYATHSSNERQDLYSARPVTRQPIRGNDWHRRERRLSRQQQRRSSRPRELREGFEFEYID